MVLRTEDVPITTDDDPFYAGHKRPARYDTRWINDLTRAEVEAIEGNALANETLAQNGRSFAHFDRLRSEFGEI